MSEKNNVVHYERRTLVKNFNKSSNLKHQNDKTFRRFLPLI